MAIERNPKSKIANPKLKLFRLWRVYAYLQIMWVTRDFKQFLFYLFSDGILNVAGVTAVFLLAERFDGIGAWTKHEVVFMLGYALTVRSILEMLFNFNVLWISRRVGRGQFDHTILQPQPIWMTLLTEGFCPFDSSPALLAGLGVTAWATSHLPIAVTPMWIGLLALNIAASCAIITAFSFLWGSLAFWAPRAAEEISSSALRILYDLRVFPLDGVAPALLGGLLTVAPAGFAAWLPCKALLGIGYSVLGIGGDLGQMKPNSLAQGPNTQQLTPNTLMVFITPLAALVFSALAVFVFRKGLEQYGRVGSSRYLNHGHRR